MAFHVACPITCRRICFCELGFPAELRGGAAREDFLKEVSRIEQFLSDPWLVKARENATVRVKVPKIVAAPPPPPPQFAAVGEDAAAAQVKRAALQKQAAAASVVAEDYARRFESGDLAVASVKDAGGEEQGHSTAKILCRLCLSGENEGSENARKMLPCNTCGKKYHRNCLKNWSQNRDLFHWSSWTCPSCRTCEVCRKIGDPSKFMFCKRCDGAFHCYCQQPPHKNVGHGPYLCTKHTKCHSCGSSVPGNGLSVRWFLGYTCCDACGRLFVKGNYCPVCLKVYRDSESTPMVCCDICQRWVHCPCDGISDAKYMQFQVDGNLQYVCPTCRGECSQIRNLEEAVQELWRRRDEADKDLIASLRAAAGLPTQEEIFDISPFSDDDESGPVSKNEYGRSLKFSLKGLGDKSPRKSKEHGKKSSSKKSGKKKGSEASFTGEIVAYQSSGGKADGAFRHNNKNEEIQFSGEAAILSPIAGSLTEGLSSVKDAKHKSVDEISATNTTKTSRTIKIKSRSQGLTTSKEEIGNNSGVTKNAQGPKLVIHLGGRTRNATTSPISEPATLKTGQESTSLRGRNIDDTDQVKGSKLGEKDAHVMKLKNANSEPSEGYESVSPKNAYSVLGKRGVQDGARSGSDNPVSKRNKYSSTKAEEGSASGDLVDDSSSLPMTKDHKPFLKFKIPKSSTNGNQNSVSSNSSSGNQIHLPLPGKEDVTYTRGQRSKRRRPAVADEDTSQWREDNTVKDFTDANWILQKLGKDAAGKRVEIHQPSNNTWHRGTVIEVFEGTSVVSIDLDDGTTKTYELGKQGIRFVSQKQKH